MAIIEPKVHEFFATAGGVCVYVNVGRRAVRVRFSSLDGPGTVDASSDEVALGVATKAFEKHKRQLQPLFEHIAVEVRRRAG